MPRSSARSVKVLLPLFIIGELGQITEGVAHARRDEDILEAVVVEVAGGDAPGHRRLHIPALSEISSNFTAAQVLEERVAEQHLVVLDVEFLGLEFLLLNGLFFLDLS